jgi:hypothetical protein
MATQVAHALMPNVSTSSTSGDNDLQPKATKAFMSFHIVSCAAHAVRNTSVAPIATVTTDDEDVKATMTKVQAGLADLTTKLDTAKLTAESWINDLCTRASQTIPNHILDYGATYDAASDEILDLLNQAKSGNDAPKLVADALDLITALRDAVSGYRAELDKVKTDLDAYAKKVQTDHDGLAGSNDAIATLVSLEGSEVQKFKDRVTFLQGEVDAWNKQIMDAEIGTGLSIFTAVVGAVVAFVPGGQTIGIGMIVAGGAGIAASGAIWGTLQQKVNAAQNEMGDDQAAETALNNQITALNGLHLIVANVVDKITAAQLALSDIAVFWGTFESTLDDVISKLGKPNAKLSVVMDEMWVKAAKNNWKTLTEFAQNLVDAKVDAEYRDKASDKAA